MGSINVGHLYKKRTVRNMDGSIRELFDEADGGWIIRGGRVVNEEKFAELQRIEEDRKLAAQAVLHQKTEENVPDRSVTGEEAIKNQSRLDELEKKQDSMDSKLDAILKAIQK